MMKTKMLLIAVGIVAISFSCKKIDFNPKNLFVKDKKVFQEKENHCPIVEERNVPAEVTTALYSTNPNATVIAWFNKDGQGYCAFFTDQNNMKVKKKYNNAGVLLSTELENEKKEGVETKNDRKSDKGCECELENDSDGDDD